MQVEHEESTQKCIQVKAKSHGYVIDHVEPSHGDEGLLHGLGEVHVRQALTGVEITRELKMAISPLILELFDQFKGLLQALT